MSDGTGRYAYALNNPVKYNDPSGHCWGIASGIRGLPGYGTMCSNLDQAWSIAKNPRASYKQKSIAWGYMGAVGVSHTYLAIGTIMLLKEGAVELTCGVTNCEEGGELPVGEPTDQGNKKPYSNPKNRPSYGKDQVQEVWDNAKDQDGRVFDPYTDEELFWDESRSRNGQWDMGHRPGHNYHNLWEDYMNDEITKEEFLKEYRNPDNYQPQSEYSNRSRLWDFLIR